jgi:hypothetical protein
MTNQITPMGTTVITAAITSSTMITPHGESPALSNAIGRPALV